MKKRYKIISKTRFLLFLITISTIATVLVISLLSSNKVYGSPYLYDYDEIRVKRGDTLWMIALEYMPEKYDVRDMIYEIKMMNEMELSNLYVGDIIKIPIIEK